MNEKAPKSSKADILSTAAVFYTANKQRQTVNSLEKVDASLKILNDKSEKTNQILIYQTEVLEEQTRINRSTLNETVAIKDIALKQLVKLDGIESTLERSEYLQKISNELEIISQKTDQAYREKQEAENNYLLSQKNLIFDLKVSSDELEEGKNTNLEKFFLLSNTQDLIEICDTDKFEISDKEFALKTLKDTVAYKEKARALFTKEDESDLELINKIEQEDENEQLEKLQAKLKRLKELKDSINSLSKFTSTLKPTNKAAFSKAKEDISSLSKKIKDSLNELKNK
tara:strand:+ start:460 stop:1317 length:858 start_codon:yes stop_codon:yes gene_type:complete